MGKWIGRISGVALVGFAAYGGYVYFAGGYHTRPELPKGAFSFSFKSGFRAIALDIPEERETRRYLGVPFDVPFWAEDAWSMCKRPSTEEAAEVLKQVDMGAGSRLDAICTVEADGTTIRRGAVFSVPRL
ncbi:MAG: hypothetical protein HOI95_21335 [Chromatiales bacterium]|nr:hypothetical protein [Chromatiales bacterium]